MDRGDVRYGRRRRLAVAAASLLLALSWCGGASLRLRRRRPDAGATATTTTTMTTADPASAAAPRVRRPAIEATPDDRSGARFAGGIGRDGRRRRRRRRLVDADDCIPFYHASILPSEPWTCTNSGDYPPEWVQGNAADYLFHLTGEACCEEMRRPWLAFGGDGGDDAGSSAGAPACRIVDACGDAEDGAMDDGGEGGDAGSDADADANSCAGKPYWDCIKEHDCRFDGASRACVAMEAWTNHDDDEGDGDVVGDGCAGKRYKPCVKDPRCRFDAASDACADRGPTDDGDESPVRCFGLSMKRCVKSGCAYDAYGGVCLPPSRPPQPPSAGPTLGPTDPVAYCGGRKYHPTNVVERRCSNGDAYPALWDSDPAKFFFEGGEDCCATFYPGGDCDVVNVCSVAADENDDGPPSPGDAYCGEKSRKHCVKDARCDYVESSHTCVAHGAYVGPPSPWDAHCEGLSKKRCAKDVRCDYVAASDACLGNGAYVPEDAEAGGRPSATTPSPATPQPMITPNPTASRPTSSSPTVEPTDAPSTPAPTYETYEPTTSFPTLSPVTPAPVTLANDGSVVDPECYENPWHLSRAPRTKDQYCTNDRNHPEAWYHPAMRPHFLFDAPDECCRTNFGVADCDVWDVCVEGTPAPATGAPTALPTFEPWPTFAPSEITADLSRTSETTCRNKWHVSADPADAGNTCTNDGDYPRSWNQPSKSQYFLFDTAAGCCEGVFPDAPCELYNVCPVGGDYAADEAEPEETPAPAPPTRRTPTERPTRRPTGRPTRRDPWYVDRTSGKCVQDCPGGPPCGGRRPQWETPYATPDACCASMPWMAFDACLTTPSPTGPPPPTADPTERPTRSPRVRPTRRPTPPPTTRKPTREPTAPPTIDCSVYKWHMSTLPGEENTCSNSPEFPSNWLDNANFFLHDTSDLCCERVFSGMDCEVMDWCAVQNQVKANEAALANQNNDDGGGGGGQPLIDCSIYKWHISMTEKSTCTNSDRYPDAWLANPQFFFHSTGDACCEVAFVGTSCQVRDWCAEQPNAGYPDQGGGGDDAGNDQGSGPAKPTFDPLVGGEDDFEGGGSLPWDFGVPPQWAIDDSVGVSGGSLTNVGSDAPGAVNTLTLRVNLSKAGFVSCMAKLEIGMPFDRFFFSVDGTVRNTYWQRNEEWIKIISALEPGESTVEFVVMRGDMYPAFNRLDQRERYGTGSVWLDDCRVNLIR